MIIEIGFNCLDGDNWWFDIGISCQKTENHPTKKMVFAIALAIATIYIRWKNKYS
jgi:hypothetical protein